MSGAENKAPRKPVTRPARDYDAPLPLISPRPARLGHAPGGDVDRMIALCRSFPSLDRRELPVPWNAARFDAWARGPWLTSGSLHAARFVLAVWAGKAYDRDDRVRTVAAVEDDAGTWPSWDDREGGVPASVTVPTILAIRPVWTVGAFDVIEAFSSWDERHRAAFAAWCAAPWWP